MCLCAEEGKEKKKKQEADLGPQILLLCFEDKQKRIKGRGGSKRIRSDHDQEEAVKNKKEDAFMKREELDQKQQETHLMKRKKMKKKGVGT